MELWLIALVVGIFVAIIVGWMVAKRETDSEGGFVFGIIAGAIAGGGILAINHFFFV